MEHLTKRSGYYYFRIAVPRDLVSVIERREIKKALKTRRSQYARSLAKVWGFQTERLFFTLRSGMLTQEQIKKAVNEFFHRTRRELEDNRLMGVGVPDKPEGYYAPDDPEGENEIDTVIENYRDFIAGLREDLAYSNFKPYETSVDELLREQGVTLDKGSVDYKRVCVGYMRAWIDIYGIEKERAMGNYNNGYDLMRSRVTVQAVPTTSGAVSRGKTLSELIKLYLASKKPQWKAETYNEYERTFSMLLEYLGDVDVTGIRREDFERFRDLLMVLPPNKAKVKEWKGKALQEIERLLAQNPLPPSKRLAEKTRNGLLERVTGLIHWAEDMDYVKKNLAKRLAIKAKKQSAREDWKPYERADLKKLLESPWYTKPQKDCEAARRWIPIIALYTGMRLGEICQLSLSDIEQDEATGIYYFNINVEEGAYEDEVIERKRQKSVKTAAGIRFVPIHPALITLGLLKYVERLREKGEERLWPTLRTYNKRQYYSFLGIPMKSATRCDPNGPPGPEQSGHPL